MPHLTQKTTPPASSGVSALELPNVLAADVRALLQAAADDGLTRERLEESCRQLEEIRTQIELARAQLQDQLGDGADVGAIATAESSLARVADLADDADEALAEARAGVDERELEARRSELRDRIREHNARAAKADKAIEKHIELLADAFGEGRSLAGAASALREQARELQVGDDIAVPGRSARGSLWADVVLRDRYGSVLFSNYAGRVHPGRPSDAGLLPHERTLVRAARQQPNESEAASAEWVPISPTAKGREVSVRQPRQQCARRRLAAGPALPAGALLAHVTLLDGSRRSHVDSTVLHPIDNRYHRPDAVLIEAVPARTEEREVEVAIAGPVRASSLRIPAVFGSRGEQLLDVLRSGRFDVQEE